MLSSVMYGVYVVGYVLLWRKVAGALVERVRQREQRSPWVEEYVRCALLGSLFCLVWPPIAVVWWVRRAIVRLDAGREDSGVRVQPTSAAADRSRSGEASRGRDRQAGAAGRSGVTRGTTAAGASWLGRAEQARDAVKLQPGVALLVVDGDGAGRLRVEQGAKREDGAGIGGTLGELADDAQHELAFGKERKRGSAAQHDAPPGKDEWIARARPVRIGEGALKRLRCPSSRRLGAQLAQTIFDELVSVGAGSDHDPGGDQLIGGPPRTAAGDRDHADLDRAHGDGQARQEDSEPLGAGPGRQEETDRGQRRQAGDTAARQPFAGARPTDRILKRHAPRTCH